MSIMNLQDSTGLTHYKPTKTYLADIPWEKIIFDLVLNFRDEIVYNRNHPGMRELMDSIHVKGFLESGRCVVHKEPNGMFDMLKGNRRAHALFNLGIKIVPCIVLEGLTPEQKLMERSDHDQEEEIGEIGRYKAVRAWKEFGLSRKAIAQTLRWFTGKEKKNPDTSKVQAYDELCGLPKLIQDQWILQQRDPLSKEVKLPEISKKVIRHLYEQKTADEKSGFHGNDGPALTAEIATLVATGVTTKTAQVKAGQNPTGLKSIGDTLDNKVFKMFMLGLAGEKGPDGKVIPHVPYMKQIELACNMVFPNVAPENAPATVEEIFDSEPAAEVISEGVVESVGTVAPVVSKSRKGSK